MGDWWRITITDRRGERYIRFGQATGYDDAMEMAKLELTRGVGLSIEGVEPEPLGVVAVLAYRVPPPYPQE